MHRYLIVMAALLMGSSVAVAQEHGDASPESLPDTLAEQYKTVRLIARAYGDSIVLRWATDDAGLWLAAKDYGWMVYRATASDDGSKFSVNKYGDTIPYRAIKGGPLKPLSLEEMMQRFDSTDYYAGAAAQALYGAFHNNINDEAQSANVDFMTMAARQYQEQTQRHFMAMLAAECSPQVAEALALRFVDREVVPGEYYEYIVQCMVPQSLVSVVDPEILVYNTPFERKEEEMLPELTVTQLDQYHVAVRWDKNKLSGYYVDRRDDANAEWVTLTPNAPLWPMLPDEGTRAVFGDSVARWMENEVIFFDSLDLKRTYTYRVRAFDAFGATVDPRESQPYKLTDFVPPAPPYVREITPVDNRICPIKWVQPGSTDDVAGYMVMFSPTLEGPWKDVSGILPRNATSYTDSNAYLRGRGYYRIFVSDTAGNVNFSGSMLNNIEDITPPASPIGLNAIPDDSTGLILLYWNKNTESDLLAYKVYFANQRDHEFIELTPGYINDTIYFDSVDITMLARDVYYYVVAVDNNHNYSRPSDTLRVLLPDLLPPGVCVLESVSQDEDSVSIHWRASISEDVASYFVYRKLRPAVSWECVAVITPDKVDSKGLIHFGDRPQPSAHPYSYCIEARDSATNSSGFAGFAVAQVDPSSIIQVPITLKASYKKGKTTLTWKYTYDGRKDYYGVVYRADGNGQFHDIGAFSRKEQSFVDTSAPSDTKCTYYIQLKLGSGRESAPSNQVTVTTK